jgi:hypothetical protein
VADPKDRWDKAAIMLAPAQAIALAVFGWILTDSVNATLKRQELDLQAIGGMRETLTVFQSSSASTEQLSGAALTLTVFGPRAVQPLVSLLEGSGRDRARAAKSALRVLGETETGAVCQGLIASLRRSGLHSIFTLNDAVELVGLLRCREACAELLALQRAATGDPDAALKTLQGRVASTPPATGPAVKDLQQQLTASIAAIQGGTCR